MIYFFMEGTMYFGNTLEGVDSGDSSNGTTTPEAGTATPAKRAKMRKPLELRLLREPTLPSSHQEAIGRNFNYLLRCLYAPPLNNSSP
jgi:hypothetical protein